MPAITSLKFLVAVSLLLSASLTWAQDFRNSSEYNLQGGVGLKGFDPVAVFPEGGSQPLEGLSELSFDYKGVIYYFASEENLDLFMEKPEKYEPTYGGWCAFAMASGTKVDIQPEIFTIHGQRVHYFISSRAKRNFDREVLDFEMRADQFWKEISGEDPRF